MNKALFLLASTFGRIASGVSIPVVDCQCIGAILNNVCYSSVAQAIEYSKDGDTIFVERDLAINTPISFSQSLTFKGLLCNSTRPYLIATFDSPDRAILEAIDPNTQSIDIYDLGFTSYGGSAAAFHSLGNETNAGGQQIKMSLRNVRVSHMKSERPGVGVFIGSSIGLEVDEYCVFDHLSMSTDTPQLYAGGAAIAVIYLNSQSSMVIKGVFFSNSAEYPRGSRHSSDGAVYLDYMEGTVEIYGSFHGNSANQGGAVHVQGVMGNFLFNGVYSDNISLDAGYGSRGGAIRILALRSTANCTIDGFYYNNTAEGRGGILATNIHNQGGILTIKGMYENNTATDSGGIWGFWSDNTSLNGTGTVIFDGSAVFHGNQALRKPETSIFYINDNENSATLSESQWTGQTIRIN